MKLFELCGVPYNKHKTRTHLEMMTEMPTKWYKMDRKDLCRIQTTDQAEALIPYLCLIEPRSYGSRFCSEMNSSYVEKVGLNFTPTDRTKTLAELDQVTRQKLKLLINIGKDHINIGSEDTLTFNKLQNAMTFPVAMELPRFSLLAKMLTSPGGW